VLPVALIFTVPTIAAIACDVEEGAALGAEIGGLLFGPQESGSTLALRNVNLGNWAADPRRAFSIDPEMQAKTINDWQGRGWELVGSYHSHPSGNAAMSNADAATAEVTGKLLIIGPGKTWQWRLYDPASRSEVGFRVAPPGQYGEGELWPGWPSFT
jgi:desampylase